MAAAVAVQGHSIGSLRLAGRPKSPDTQLLLHVVIHGKTDDLSVVAVQNCRQVQPAVQKLDLRDIRQPLPVGGVCGKVPLDQVLRFLRSQVRFCQTVGVTRSAMEQASALHGTPYACFGLPQYRAV